MFSIIFAVWRRSERDISHIYFLLSFIFNKEKWTCFHRQTVAVIISLQFEWLLNLVFSVALPKNISEIDSLLVIHHERNEWDSTWVWIYWASWLKLIWCLIASINAVAIKTGVLVILAIIFRVFIEIIASTWILKQVLSLLSEKQVSSLCQWESLALNLAWRSRKSWLNLLCLLVFFCGAF